MNTANNTICRCNLNKDIFNKPKVEDGKYFYNITAKTGHIISGYDFVNFFLWADSHNGGWRIYEDWLLIYYGDVDALMLPIGLNEIRISELIRISDKMRECRSTGNFIYVDGDYVEEHLDNLEQHFDIVEDPNNADYVHRVSDLVELNGKRLKKKRNLVKQFVNNNPGYSIETISNAHLKGCLDLTKAWSIDKDQSGKGHFGNDLSQFEHAIENYDELGLDGIALLINGKVEAFSMFTSQTEDTAICSFEKYNPDIKGAGQIINNEFAKVLQEKGYTYVNREQDLGIEGLRRAKRSYDPLFTKTVYNLIRK